MKSWLIVGLLLVLLLIAACGAEPTAVPTEGTTFESPLNMPNPASVYCEEQGYTLEIRDEVGGQVGYCIFGDGTECEEWAFYRGECGLGTPKP